MKMKKTALLLVLALSFVFLGISCSDGNVSNVSRVSFLPEESKAKAISSSAGNQIYTFSDVTAQRIKFQCIEGKGFCSLAGALDGFVEWPEGDVQFSYGVWKAYACGENYGKKIYESDPEGITFIIGPQGASLDGGATWVEEITVKESYKNDTVPQLMLPLSLSVRDENGNLIELNNGYVQYSVKWYLSRKENPTNLLRARTLSELQAEGTEFYRWSNERETLGLTKEKYIVAVIVSSSNDGLIYGSSYMRLDNLFAGYCYTVGSELNDFVQFGKYRISFNAPEASPSQV